MDYSQEWLPLGNELAEITTDIAQLKETMPEVSRHFSQSEDFFIRLPQPVHIPALPIHHDVKLLQPKPALREGLHTAIQNAAQIVPGLFHGLRFFFNPLDSLRPTFFRSYSVNGSPFLYLLRLDLIFRPNSHTIEQEGTNDIAPAYSTTDLILESDIIPLETIKNSESGKLAKIRHSISDTWIGETGRGYFVQGIWIDRDLTRFFSKLFTPPGKRFYPFYPITCKYQAICHTAIHLGKNGRHKILPFVWKTANFLEKHIKKIQQTLKEHEFSDVLPLFKELKEMVPPSLAEEWNSIQIKPYLNEQNQKEFEILDTTTE